MLIKILSLTVECVLISLCLCILQLAIKTMARHVAVVLLGIAVTLTQTVTIDAKCKCVNATYCTSPHYESESSQPCQGEDEVCCQRVEVTEQSCGYYVTDSDSVPWMTVISDAAANQSLGSGTFIHPGAIVTTANIIMGRQAANISVRINAHSWKSSDEAAIKVQRIIIHKNFDNTYLSNNIALLILKTPVTLTDEVRVLCLPNQGERFEEKVCKFAGWDSTKTEDERGLKQNQQYVLKKEQCQDDLRSFESHFPHWLHLHSSMMCTIGDYPYERPSKGDGGAPLFCEIHGSTDRYVLAGMAAWKTPDSGPAVFTNVARFRDWLDDYLGRLNHGVQMHKL